VGCSASLGILLTLPVVGKLSDVPISHMISDDQHARQHDPHQHTESVDTFVILKQALNMPGRAEGRPRILVCLGAPKGARTQSLSSIIASLPVRIYLFLGATDGSTQCAKQRAGWRARSACAWLGAVQSTGRPQRHPALWRLHCTAGRGARARGFGAAKPQGCVGTFALVSHCTDTKKSECVSLKLRSDHQCAVESPETFYEV